MSAERKAAPRPQLKKTAHGQLIYRPGGRVIANYLMDNSHVAVIRGPIGSGKSVASCQRIWRHACEQIPSPVDGVKRSRWAVVRNTYPELKSTTVKTWLDIFPENLYGSFYWGMPLTHRMKVANVEVEAIFIALDKPEDVSKLRSLELTGIWYNELQYIPRELFDEGESRTGRFPAMKDGGSKWHGVIADMNEPDEDHFVPMMTGEVDLPEGMPQDEREKYVWPSDWAYFIQPPGLIEKIGPDGRSVVGYEENPAAENRDWLLPNFYMEKGKGKTKAWIESRLMNRINLYVEGDPVHSAFSVETHVAREALKPVPGRTIYVGLDFGRSPAALFAQLVDNCWLVLDELIGFNEGAAMFAPKVKRFLEQRFPGYEYEAWGDPKGQDKGQADERTAYDIFLANGIRVRPAPVKQNAIQTRLDAVDNALTTMWNGKPRMLVSPVCRTFRAGMAGKYCWAKDDEGKKAPAKNRWSHICDAGQYMVLGGGEGKEMLGLRRHGGEPRKKVLAFRRGAGRRFG